MKIFKLRIVNKFGFISILVFILVFLFFYSTMILKANVAQGVDELKYVEIYIKPGDTLWDLAKKFTPPNKDIRKTIYQISQINQLNTSKIYPGQIIKIPVQ